MFLKIGYSSLIKCPTGYVGFHMIGHSVDICNQYLHGRGLLVSKYTVIEIIPLQYPGSAVTACDFPQDFGGSAYDLGILSSNLGTFLLCLRKVHFTCNMVVFSHKYTMSKLTVLPSVMILQLLFTFLADLYTPHTQTSRNSFTANCYLILICGKNFTYTDNFGYILGCWQFCLIL